MTEDLIAANPGVWMYAVTRGLEPQRLAGITGVGGQAVRTVPAAGLVAVVGSVDLNEFGEEPLGGNLEDLVWLEVTARAHNRVAEVLAHLGPVVPTRLATVYRDDVRVGEVLARRRDDLTAALDQVAGRTEWGVKAYASPGATGADGPVPATGATAATGASGPGADYLRRRRALLSAKEQALRAAVDSVEEVHVALGRRSEAARRHAPQPRELTGEAGWMVLNGAYLVDARRETEFADAVTTLADRHRAIRLELTGPWPPYSFATIREEPAG